MHLDRRLAWAKHNKTNRKQPHFKAKQIHWLLGRSTLLYKAVLKPIWTYGIQPWGTASNSNTEILQRFQSKTLRSILNSPWYISKHRIHADVQMNAVLGGRKKWITR
jgi:hypothetical protein